ncbi:MAG: TIGR03067 domain-containing protein [Gemmataceae bacterium]
MRSFCLLFLCVGLAVAQGKKDAAKEELEKLQGTWYLVVGEFDGKTINVLDLDGKAKCTVKGNNFEFPSKEMLVSFLVKDKGPRRPVLKQILTNREDIKASSTTEKVQFKLNPATNPRQIDLTLAAANLTAKGVYEISGETLTVCIGPNPEMRPKTLKDEGAARVTLVREKAFKKHEEDFLEIARAELKKFQGTWNLIEGRYDHTPLNDKEIKDFQLVFKDDQLTWKEAGQSETLKVLVDPRSKPAASIALQRIQEDGKGNSAAGIYQLDGDRLILRLRWNHLLERPSSLDFAKKQGEDALLGTGYQEAGDARLVFKKAK